MAATTNDRRSPAQKETHTWAIVATDRGMSGWGRASGGASYVAWAVPAGDHAALAATEAWVERRSDMARTRFAVLTDYRPRCAHLSIYPVGEDHPALDSLRRTAQR